MPYELFEHTADIGLRVRAKDLTGLFKDAAEGLFELATDPRAVRSAPGGEVREVEMNFQEENAAELFMHWLQELLFFFSARNLVLTDPTFISLTPMMLRMKGKGVRFDPAKHPSRHEIKAVTHHGFRVTQIRGGWEAEVVFDI